MSLEVDHLGLSGFAREPFRGGQGGFDRVGRWEDATLYEPTCGEVDDIVAVGQ